MATSPTPVIPEEQWEANKAMIYQLYITDNRRLQGPKGVMEKMRDESKAQYERRLKKWGFKKYQTKSLWKEFATGKRTIKLEERDGEVVIDGIVVPLKKFKKETRRYRDRTDLGESQYSPSKASAMGVVAVRSPRSRTLSPQPNTAIWRVWRLPVIQFTDFLEPFRRGRNSAASFNLGTTESIIPRNPTLRLDYPSTLPIIESRAMLSFLQGFGFASQSRIEHSNLLQTAIQAMVPPNLLEFESIELDHAWKDINLTDTHTLTRLIVFIISNGLHQSIDVRHEYDDVAQDIMSLIISHVPLSFAKYLCSKHHATSEAFLEKLFPVAVGAGNAEIVRTLLDTGVKPQDPKDLTKMLHLACSKPSFVVAKLLVQAGADVNGNPSNPKTLTPLELALDMDSDRPPTEEIGMLIKMLLDNGATIPPPRKFHYCLFTAVWMHQTGVVQMLIDNGADVNYKHEETTALSLALGIVPKRGAPMRLRKPTGYICSSEIVYTLLSAGAKIQDPKILPEAIRLNDFGVIEGCLTAGAKFSPLSLFRLCLEMDMAYVDRTIHVGVENYRNHNQAKQWTWNDVESAYNPFARAASSSQSATTFASGTDTYYMNTAEEPLTAQRNMLHMESIIKALKKLPRSFNEICLQCLLNSAIRSSRVEVIKLITLAGANLNAWGPKLPLLQAIESGNRQLIPLLLSLGASIDVSSFDSSIESPVELCLNLAVHLEDVSAIRELMQAGASPLWCRSSTIGEGYRIGPVDECALTTAVKNGNKQVLDALLNIPLTSLKVTPEFQSCLLTAVERGDISLAKMLLAACDNINLSFPESDTALTAAIRGGNFDMIGLVLAAGADVNVKSARGLTPLDAACRTGDMNLVGHLLNLGASRSDPGVMITAVLMDFTILDKLFDGAGHQFSHAVASAAYGALQIAIKEQNIPAVRLLLEKGALVNTRQNLLTFLTQPRFYPDQLPNENDRDYTHPGLSPVYIAIRYGEGDSLPILRMLLDAGADPNGMARDNSTVLLEAIKNHNMAAVEILVSAGAEVNKPAAYGIKFTPLQAAAARGYLDIAKKLIKLGANVNAAPAFRNGATALQFAAAKGFVGLACYLLEHGADVNAPGAKIGGRTALEGAAEWGRIDMIQLLVDSGAIITGLGNEQYKRSLELAAKNGHDAVKRKLESLHAEQSETINPQILFNQ